jgi:ribonuclease BN (tRNA processing enzyme)
MTEISFIGTSDAFGAGGRRQSAVLLRAPSGAVLLDCGPTTLTGLVSMGLPRDEVDVIVVSHYHGDHFGGIPMFLLAAIYEDRRRRPLEIVGPAGVVEWVSTASAALGHPIFEREIPFPLSFQEFAEGADVDAGPVRVSAFKVNHDPESMPHGFIVSAEGRRVVYSGDTGWFEGLLSRVRGADLLICECTQFERSYPLHLSHAELLAKKGELHCGRVILTHLGPDMWERRRECAFETADDGLVVRL